MQDLFKKFIQDLKISQNIRESLDKPRTNEELKTYEIVGCWPSTVSPIELSYESTGAIEEFTVTLEYQYFKTNTTD